MTYRVLGIVNVQSTVAAIDVADAIEQFRYEHPGACPTDVAANGVTEPIYGQCVYCKKWLLASQVEEDFEGDLACAPCLVDLTDLK